MAERERSRPIGVFDSGVGGLTVLHECLVSLPHEDFVYLGDTARFPYGNREAAELREFALELAELLLEDGAKLLVVACNSATSAALPQLREELRGRVGVDTVILGCTHYPLVRPILQRALGRGVTIVSSGQAIADAVHTELAARGLENHPDRRGRYSFLATGDPEAFRALGTRFLQM